MSHTLVTLHVHYTSTLPSAFAHRPSLTACRFQQSGSKVTSFNRSSSVQIAVFANSRADKRKMNLSTSQQLTLGYAALLGAGGVMGFVKGGSGKSLAAGGASALLLYHVYNQLPERPLYASTLGLGTSVTLLGVMGSRFKKSGKMFPGGVVSLASLVMACGYLHGIMRSA